jgi:hypothetical protein
MLFWVVFFQAATGGAKYAEIALRPDIAGIAGGKVTNK